MKSTLITGFVLILCTIFINPLIGQTDEDAEQAREIFKVAEFMPTWEGCEDKLTGKERSNCTNISAKVYVYQALGISTDKDKSKGTAYQIVAKLLINTSGNVESVEILQRGETPYDEQLEEVFLSMPDWNPAKHRDRIVDCYISLPIKLYEIDN